MNILMQTLRSLLNKCIEDIDSGSCNLNDEELTEVIFLIQKYSRRDTPYSTYSLIKKIGREVKCSNDNT